MRSVAKAAPEARVVPSSNGAAEIRDFVAVLEQRAGLCLSSDSVEETERRLSGILRELQLPRGQELLDSVRRSDRILQRIVNRLTVGESYFFRNRPHFEALRRTIIPAIVEANRSWRSLRIWCAGCARGEEPYSLSILLREDFSELLRWDVSITATDINTDFLDKAGTGIYTRWSLRGVEPELLQKYFAKVGDNAYQLDEKIRRTVDFKHANLREYSDSAETCEQFYDLVLCRNVLIYFTVARSLEIIRALARSLRLGGYLLLGHSEAVPVPLELETVHFDATYAYRRISDQQVAASIRPRPNNSMLPIPGTGALSLLPPRPISVLPPVEIKPTAEPFRRTRSRRAVEQPGQRPRSAESIGETEMRIERAREHADRGEIAEAHSILEKLVSEASVLDHRIHFLFAIVSDQLGRPKETVASLKRSIYLHKDFVLGHYYLGVVLEREGNTRPAERYLRNARNLLLKLPEDGLLEEAEGLTSGRLLEIVEARLRELSLG